MLSSTEQLRNTLMLPGGEAKSDGTFCIELKNKGENPHMLPCNRNEQENESKGRALTIEAFGKQDPIPTGSSFVPRSKEHKWGPKQCMAETQVLHPSLEGSGYLCCTALGVLHGVGLEPVLLFLNLGLKVPPKQN